MCDAAPARLGVVASKGTEVQQRRRNSPERGREVVVPGQFAQGLPNGRVVEPPMTILDPKGGPPVFIPGGQRREGILP